MNTLVNKSTIATLAQSSRPPFLLLTPCIIFLGAAFAAYHGAVNIPYALIALLGGLAAHISVNTFNEYFDFKSGLDAQTKRTPFSGGSGALIQHSSAAKAVLFLAISALLLSIAIGLFFVSVVGTAIIPLGVLGVLIVFSYTSILNKHALLCWLSPGLSFGPLMVVGTYLAIAGEYNMQVWLLSLIPFFLMNNLLLMNQYPDYEADKISGRRHLIIAYSKRLGAHVYGASVLFALAILLTCIILKVLPVYSLIAVAPILIGLNVYYQLLHNNDDFQRLLPYMAINVAISLSVPVLIALSLLL